MLRCAYLDLDASEPLARLGARALEACARAGVEVVPVSGRGQAELAADAARLGARSYVFESGAGLVVDGEAESLTDASAALAVARHMQARGYAPEDTIAVGSAERLGMADVVGELWLLGAADSGGRANVRVTEESAGPGVYEAIITTLAERR